MAKFLKSFMKYRGSKLSEDAFINRQFKNIMLPVPDNNGVVTINEKKTTVEHKKSKILSRDSVVSVFWRVLIFI